MPGIKTVAFLRSTSIVNDSRTTKEINSLSKAGYEVTAFGWDRDGFYAKNRDQFSNSQYKLKHFKVKSQYGLGLPTLLKLVLFQIWLLVNLIISIQKYSIIHSCDFDTAIPAVIVAKLFRKKLVYDIFDYYIHSHNIPLKLEKIIENTEILIINFSDAVIICNEARYEQIGKANPKKCIVIHNTPELPPNLKISPQNQDNKKAFKICYVGILQNGRLLTEVAESIKGKNEFELHIGGFGKLDFYFKKLSENYSNIYFYGQMTYENVLRLESECDVLFATYDPSIKNHRFSAPNKVYEAMALGKPVIVCKNTGTDKIVTENGIGICIDYNAEAFYEAISFLSKNKIVCNEMGNKGRKIYKEKYSWSIMEHRILSFYSSIREN